MNTKGTHIIRIAAGLLALALGGTGVVSAQYTWTGSADNNWFNAANWQITGTTGIPDIPNSSSAITYHWANAKNKILDIYTTGTVSVAELHRYDSDSGFTLNIKSTSVTDWLAFDVNGAGFSRDGTIPNSNMLALVTIGKNTILSYSGTLAKSEFLYLKLKDNAIFDTRAYTVAGATVTFRQINTDPGTIIYLGDKKLAVGRSINVGGGENVIASSIIGETTASYRARLGRPTPLNSDGTGGDGIVRITGSNNFDRSPIPTGAAIDNHYSTIENGTFIVDSSLGHVRMGSGNLNARIGLAGTGTVGSVLVQFGKISAGDGVNNVKTGILTIEGNLDITGGGNLTTGDVYAAGLYSTALIADFGAKGAYDRINVTGTTTIKGTKNAFQVNIPSGELYAGDYTVLKSNGGIVFEGATNFVNVSLPGTLTIDFSGPFIDDGGTALKLRLTQKYFGDIAGLTPGQQSVAKFLDDLWADGTPGDPTSYDPLVGVMNGKMSFSTLTAAMNQLSGQAYSHLYTAEVAEMNHLTEKIEGRHGAPLTEENVKKTNFYFAPSYDEASVESTADTEKAKLKMEHYTLGATHLFGSDWTLGLAIDFGIGDYELDAQRSFADTDTVTGIASISYAKKHFSVGAMLMGGWNSYSVSRSVSMTRLADIVTAEFDGSHSGFDVWANYELQFKWGSIKPYGKLYWMRWDADSFKEVGADAVRLDVGSQSEDSLQSRVGFRIDSILNAHNIKGGMIWRPFVDVSWVQQWTGTDRREINMTIIGRPMTAVTAKPDATGWRGSAGVSIDATKRLNIEFSISGQLGGLMDNQFGYSAVVGWRF